MPLPTATQLPVRRRKRARPARDVSPQIEMRDARALKAYAKNARRHSARQIIQIKNSMIAFGFMNPILVDKNGVVIAGHGRLAAATELRLTKIPTICATHLSDAQVRAYRLADNKIAENSDWDADLLRVELNDLIELDLTGALDFDIGAIGFETAELDLATASPAEVIGQETVAPPAEDAVSRQADLWQLGRHRIFCGSALDTASYGRLLGKDHAQMVITDPPYNVPVSGHVRAAKAGHEEFAMASGEMSEAEFAAFLKTALRCTTAVCDPGSVVMSFMDWRHFDTLSKAARSCDLEQLNLCVWVKTNGGMGSLYRSQHELCGVFRMPGKSHRNNVQLGKFGRNRTNVWTYAGVNTFRTGRKADLVDHPTVKPTAMIEDAIRDVTAHGDIVLDPFGGSGSALLAAEKSGRRVRLIELEPRYVDVVIRRWQEATDAEAVHVDTGETWNSRRASGVKEGDHV